VNNNLHTKLHFSLQTFWQQVSGYKAKNKTCNFAFVKKFSVTILNERFALERLNNKKIRKLNLFLF